MTAREQVEAIFQSPAPTTLEEEYMRQAANILHLSIQQLCPLLPEGREKAIVLNKMEEVWLWTQAAIRKGV